MTLRVLIVDDDADMREFVEFLLEMLGHTVTACAGVRQALTHLTSALPDVVVTDLNLADGSGVDVARESWRRGLPVVIMTASPEDLPTEHGTPVFLLAKPFGVHELGRVIDQAAGRDRRSEAGGRDHA